MENGERRNDLDDAAQTRYECRAPAGAPAVSPSLRLAMICEFRLAGKSNLVKDPMDSSRMAGAMAAMESFEARYRPK